MLVLSTLLAAIFCTLYLTKPVVTIAGGAPAESGHSGASVAAGSSQVRPTATESAPMPNPSRLPGDPGARIAAARAPDAAHALPSGTKASALEETNLKIQHVLSAEGPEGELARVVVDVPVLYESRKLRWSAGQVAEARDLLEQLRTHQQQTRALRAEGMILLDSWKSLVARSIPAPALRADSPTLPVNQPLEHSTPAPAGRDTADSIEVQTAANE
jgi:hypothetical protein